MHIIVCLDQKNGMMFLGKRQSKDRVLRAHMLQISCGASLRMNAYSAGQFEEPSFNIRIMDDFLETAQKGDYCFVENMDVLQWEERIEDIIVYRWNRIYPASMYFPEKLLSSRNLIQKEIFAGYSHDEITQEVYAL